MRVSLRVTVRAYRIRELPTGLRAIYILKNLLLKIKHSIDPYYAGVSKMAARFLRVIRVQR